MSFNLKLKVADMHFYKSKPLSVGRVFYVAAKCQDRLSSNPNKAGYTATEVACGWAGAIFEVTRSFGQEQ